MCGRLALNSTCGDVLPDCCEGLTCYDSTCQNCTDFNETCGDSVPECCGNMTCGENNTCFESNGALSLFNMNFSLKQLVGFAVVVVANGIL